MNRKLAVVLGVVLVGSASVAGGRAYISRRAATTTPGPSANGHSMTLPNGWRISPAGKQIDLPGDLVFKMLLTPDGKGLVVNTGGFHDHGVTLIDLQTDRIKSTINVWKDWAGMAMDSATGTVFVSGGGPMNPEFLVQMNKAGASRSEIDEAGKDLHRLMLNDGNLQAESGLAIPDLAYGDRFTAGVALAPGGGVLVVNTQNDSVYRLSQDGTSAPLSARVGYRPYAVVVSPDTQRVAVSNWGDESVSLLDARTLKEIAKVKTGSHPNEMAYGKDGRLWVACAGSNSVTVIQGTEVIETVKTSLDPNDPVGATPDALALSPDGTTLYVANADNNDVVVIDISQKKQSRVLGFVPTGWYPSAVTVSGDGGKIFVGMGKGLASRPNAPAQGGEKAISANSKSPYDYIGRVLGGAVSVIDVPDKAQLEAYTLQVRANRPQPEKELDTAQVSRIEKEVFPKIKHVLYIIRENRTFDQVFGDLGKGNGDPKLTFFGEDVTPNGHQLARQTVVFDNIYCSGEVSEDGHQWCNAAYATDFTEKAWPNSYSRRGEPKADERLTASPAGYLWDNCAKHGLSFRSYGEFASFKSDPDSAPMFVGNHGLRGHASEAWDLAGKMGRDTDRAATFIKELKEAETSGQWPSFMVMHLGENHTEGLVAGRYTPSAHVASNDIALGKIVEAISRSKFWSETAIFVIEDDAQNGPDHVDAHRTVALVLSPYVKRGVVDSTMYSTVSMIRTMELILGLPPMTQYDRAAMPMYNAFTTETAMEAYACLPARVDLQARNPKTGSLAKASARLDFSDYDRADPDELNRILWQAYRGNEPMPAPVHSIRPGF
jgi:YVTN family beta-propeller protein